MSYHGDYLEDATVDFKFATVDGTGAPTTLSGTPALSAYKANGATQSTAGITLSVDFDTVTGLNHVRIDTSADAFYATGADYDVVITTGTVDGVSVVGYVVGSFSIENRVGATASDRVLLALPAAAADAAGGLPISDAGGLDLDNRMPAATAVTNLNTVFNTDFATNYDATNDAWKVRHQGTLATLDALDTAQDAQHAATQAFVDTEIGDIQSRIPAALTAAGNIKADIEEILEDTTALGNLATAFGSALGGGGSDRLLVVLADDSHGGGSSSIQSAFTGSLSGNVGGKVLGGGSSSLIGVGVNTGDIMIDSAIDVVNSQTDITITAGSDDDDAYNYCEALFFDQVTNEQRGFAVVDDYIVTAGPSRRLLLKSAPQFTVASGDLIRIKVNTALKPTTSNRTLDVTATGAAGVDWSNVENPTTTLDLSGTTIKTATDIATLINALNDIAAADVWAAGTRTLTALDEDSTTIDLDAAIRAAVGMASASYDTDISGINTKLDTIDNFVDTEVAALTTELAKVPKSDGTATWNATALASIQAEANDALIANNLDHLCLTATAAADMTAEVADNTILARILSNGDTSVFDPSTDGLQPIRDRGDAAWITATGFSTHSAADVWSAGTRVLTAGTNIVLAKGTGVTGFNDLSAAQVNAEVDTALTDIGLDHLLAASVAGTDVTDNSIVAKLVSKSATADWDSFANTTDSLEALRDRGDAAWTTATGFSTLDAAGIRTAVGLASANLDTQLAAIDNAVDTEVAAIVTTLGTAGDGLTDIPWNPDWDAEVQSEVTDALTTALAEGYRANGAAGSVRDLLYEINQTLGEATIAVLTRTVKKIDHSATALTHTLNADPPTSITRAT